MLQSPYNATWSYSAAKPPFIFSAFGITCTYLDSTCSSSYSSLKGIPQIATSAIEAEANIGRGEPDIFKGDYEIEKLGIGKSWISMQDDKV